MGLHQRFSALLALSATAALFAGCSGARNQIPTTANVTTPQSGDRAAMSVHFNHSISVAAHAAPVMLAPALSNPRVMNPDALNNGVFVSDPSSNAVEIMDPSSHNQIGTITGLNFPQGIGSNPSTSVGRVYVADTGSQSIAIFSAPYHGAPTRLNTPGFYPVGVHVDKMGNVWVSNICSGSGGSCTGGGNVMEFPGACATGRALNGGPYRTYFVTTDSKGNVWADGQDSSGNAMIGYWTGGKGSFHRVNIQLFFPGGIMFDNNGNMLLDDQLGASNGGSALYVIPAGHTTPSKTIALQNDGGDVVQPGINKPNTTIYGPDNSFGQTNIISYPAGHITGALNTSGTPLGAATIPAPLP